MTKEYIVPTLRTDFISVKSLKRQGYRVIHDADPEESGIFPAINGKIDESKSFGFMSEHSNLFYIKAEAMLAQQFGKVSGYEKWHRRLGHTTNREMHDTIPSVKGLEEVFRKKDIPVAYKVMLHDRKKVSGRFSRNKDQSR